MKPSGIMIALGSPKDDKGDEGDEDDERDESTETAFAKEAYSALQDKDEAGFIDAFVSTIKACMSKGQAKDYAEEEKSEGE